MPLDFTLSFMSSFSIIETFALIFGFYMAWNIGANDVANAMGTSVGSKALTLKKAVLLAAIFEFSGAFFAGASVSDTIQKGIIDPQMFQGDIQTFVLGMMGALLATGILLQIASYFGLPVSTTHSIVGSIVGFGICTKGLNGVYWTELGLIASSWVLSPVLSAVMSFGLYKIIQYFIAQKSLKFATQAGIYKESSSFEKLFIPLQIMSACYVAFAHGANDVANAIGPVAGIINALKTQTLSQQSSIPSWLLLIGSIGIVIGLATWGWRVIETVGKKITELSPSRGFAAEFGAATTILLASKFGLPVSTTHALIGAILGVGMTEGIKALNFKTLKDIVTSWIVTIPLCAGFSIACFYLLKFFMG
jgi:PiT family inorganic phosphate transporter